VSEEPASRTRGRPRGRLGCGSSAIAVILGPQPCLEDAANNGTDADIVPRGDANQLIVFAGRQPGHDLAARLDVARPAWRTSRRVWILPRHALPRTRRTKHRLLTIVGDVGVDGIANHATQALAIVLRDLFEIVTLLVRDANGEAIGRRTIELSRPAHAGAQSTAA